MFFHFRIWAIAACLTFSGSLQAIANDKHFTLFAPDKLIESGLLKYMLPRFSLKTQVRIEVVTDAETADASIDDTGKPVFSGLGQDWFLTVRTEGHKGVDRFADWIGSDVGQRAITGFVVDGVALFTLPELRETEVVELDFEGDAEVGRELSRQMCGRCHVVVAEERMNAIDSTPSFFALRSLRDWDDRFQAFYALNPHPSFTQVQDVTPPFPENRPPPIVPVEMTLEDVEAILAYVAELEPADLGAPIEHQ